MIVIIILKVLVNVILQFLWIYNKKENGFEV